MEQLINRLLHIQSVSGNEKIEVLKQYQGDRQLEYVLSFLIDPNVTTGLKEKKLSLKKYQDSKLNYIGNSPYEMLELMLRYVKDNNTGRDIDIETVMTYINTIESQVSVPPNFLAQLVCKTLKLGLTAKTVNKAWKGFMKEYNVQLAHDYSKYKDEMKDKEFIATEKLDGVRCSIFNGKAYSRSGKEISGIDHILNELKGLEDTFIDGELLIRDADEYNQREVFQVTNSLVSKKDADKSELVFHVFDMLPLNEFLDGQSKDTYSKRRKKMDEYFGFLYFEHIKLVPVLYRGNNHDCIPQLLHELESRGKEGVMVNLANGYYVTKRTKNLLKVKSFETSDLTVIGYEEGTGKNKGKLGALIVDYKGYRLGVGSGFTDEQRVDFWNSRDELIGRTVEIQHFTESQNKNGELSVSFPVFIAIRHDK